MLSNQELITLLKDAIAAMDRINSILEAIIASGKTQENNIEWDVFSQNWS